MFLRKTMFQCVCSPVDVLAVNMLTCLRALEFHHVNRSYWSVYMSRWPYLPTGHVQWLNFHGFLPYLNTFLFHFDLIILPGSSYVCDYCYHCLPDTS